MVHKVGDRVLINIQPSSKSGEWVRGIVIAANGEPEVYEYYVQEETRIDCYWFVPANEDSIRSEDENISS